MPTRRTKTDLEALPWSRTKTAIKASIAGLARCYEALTAAQVNAPTAAEARLLECVIQSVEEAHTEATKALETGEG